MMKHLLQFLLTAAFLFCLGRAQDNATNATDEAAYAKLVYADNATKAIKGDFIVVFNKSRVDDLQAIVDDLSNSTDGILIDKLHETIKMVKITVNASESGDDEEAAKLERKLKLLFWLKSDFIEIIEEVCAHKDSLDLARQLDKKWQPDRSLLSRLQDQMISVLYDQNFPTWGLDRIDQSDLPLNNQYHFDLVRTIEGSLDALVFFGSHVLSTFFDRMATVSRHILSILEFERPTKISMDERLARFPSCRTKAAKTAMVTELTSLVSK
jgi:hypothetical protein